MRCFCPYPFFWHVLTLLLQCVAPYTVTSSSEISGAELHTVVCSRRLVLHLVMNISQPGAASSHQATWHRCALVSSAYGRSFREHISHIHFLYCLALLWAPAVHLTQCPSTQLPSCVFCGLHSWIVARILKQWNSWVVVALHRCVKMWGLNV